MLANNEIEWKDHNGELRPFYRGRLVSWTPQPGGQEAVLKCPNDIYELMLHGDRGGGKSDVMLMDFAQHVGTGFGAEWRGLVLRHTYKQLEDLVEKSRKIFFSTWPEATFNESKLLWKWPTGESLQFSYLEKIGDYWSYHGRSWPFIAFDELTTWPDDTLYLRMMSCCRSTMQNMPRKFRGSTNPYGPGFNWVKDRFHLPGVEDARGRMIPEIIEFEFEDPDTKLITTQRRVAVQVMFDDNVVLKRAEPNYRARIAASASNDAMKEAWLRGSWDIVAGGMFDDIWRKAKGVLVLPPFQVPASWRIDRSFDWGSSKPFSVGWWAESDGSDLVLPNGKIMHTVPRDLFRIKEWYGWNGSANKGSYMLASDVGKGIIQREIEWGIHGRVKRGIADAAIFDDSSGASVAADMGKAFRINGTIYRGPTFDPCNKKSGSRKRGWELMRTRMRDVLPTSEGQPREKPGLFITTECTQFIRTVPTLPRKEEDLDDVNSEAEDHVADEVRYRVMKEDRTMRTGSTSGNN